MATAPTSNLQKTGQAHVADQFQQESKVQVLTASSAEVIAAASNGAPIHIKRIHLCESSGNATTATVRIVKSGGTDDATSNVLTAVALAANETLTFESGGDGDWHILEAGDALKALASVTARINIHVIYNTER